jgi:predicted PurR-regulated permease PerM
MRRSNTNAIQRFVRLALGSILLYAGLFKFGAPDGELFGLILVFASFFPLLIAITGYCPLCKNKDKEIESE